MKNNSQHIFKRTVGIAFLPMVLLGFNDEAKAQVFSGEENIGAQVEPHQETKRRLSAPVWGQRAAQGNENQDVEIREIEPVQEQNANGAQEPQIVLYMRDFKVFKTLTGIINCSAKFYVQSSVNEKISNISYRLKWPKMETPLSFDYIEPNTAVYKTYSLLGDGCYAMDKAPNVIVNRCRIKGVDAKTCAGYIRWVK